MFPRRPFHSAFSIARLAAGQCTPAYTLQYVNHRRSKVGSMRSTGLLLFAGLLGAIVVASLVPNDLRPRLWPAFDAAEHVIGYLILSSVAAAVNRSTGIIVLTAGLIGLAVTMEALQAFHPSRDASFRDLYGSIAGILAGVIAGRALVRLTIYFAKP